MNEKLLKAAEEIAEQSPLLDDPYGPDYCFYCNRTQDHRAGDFDRHTPDCPWKNLKEALREIDETTP